jgi:asparagine synthase (glutamine-hydrolysing)
MCGIAGVWGKTEQAPVYDMIKRQLHRGPDGRGFHVQRAQGVLGHVRLSIMDPAEGDQPIYSEDGSAVIVANGEVYNHALLRRNLDDAHHFVSASDSETILHLFEERKTDAIHELDGMFAFAMLDDGGLFLARDPIGIKPLYYSMVNRGTADQQMYFASELKALTRWSDDVHEFPPGTYYHSQSGFHSYYQVPQHQPRADSVDVHVRRVRETLEHAVAKRLMSDVPLGAFLSGGLDSSIIAAIARRLMPELHTFSVGIAGSRDILAARRVARHIGSIHHEYTYTAAEVLQQLPEIIYYFESFDRDLVRSAIPTYFCARMAADYVKVILTGEGADELFAGYTYYKNYNDPAALHQELHRSVSNLHNLNLQRVDRMTMRHSIEGRVPFLDTTMIELAQTIPPELKLRSMPDGTRVEKWILRKAVEDLLPHDIVWRNKEQFDEGSGTVDLLQSLLQQVTGSIDMADYQVRYPQSQLRSTEECYYHQLLVDGYEQPEAILRNVGHWQP